MKNKWRRWYIVLINEHKYNPYKDVSITKKRPVVIWNNSYKLKGKVIAFHCTSKYKKYNEDFLVKISDGTNLQKETWVNLRHLYFIDNKDIIWNKNLGVVKDKDAKEQIKNFINVFF